MAEKPFFAEQMVECARDGTNSALEVTRPKRVVLSTDGIQVGTQRIPLANVIDWEIRGNVLTLTASEEAGRRVERSFRYDTFLPGTGVRRMAEVGQWLASRLRVTAPGTATRNAGPRAEQVQAPRYTVRVHGSQVSFPPSCPVCLAPGTRAALLAVSHALDRGTWVVPACAAHPRLGSSIQVQGWSVKSSELTFSFDRPDYGERFLKANEDIQRVEAAEAAAAQREINGGVRFVVYSYAISLIVVSLKRSSGVCAIPPGSSAVLHGLPYSLVSLVLGWWGIPHGPIFTVGSLITNFRGGVDLTAALGGTICGARVSATGA